LGPDPGDGHGAFATHDIDELVCLGQRVLVMSHAPTVIMQEATIDLPDERT
jgi:NitT/TauT family transport system ATP-binding protein